MTPPIRLLGKECRPRRRRVLRPARDIVATGELSRRCAGVFALVGAYLLWVQIQRQRRQLRFESEWIALKRKRENLAARIGLPHALAELSRYWAASFESSRSLVAASRASAISGESFGVACIFLVVYPSRRDRRSSAKRSAKSTYRSQICICYQCAKHSEYRPSSASALASSINRLGEAEVAPNIGQMIGQLWALS